jgi:hypothetical protein
MGKLIGGESRRIGRPKITLVPRAPLVPTIHKPTPLFCCRRGLPFVESTLNHCVCFANQNVGRDLVLGATEFAKTREENEVIESFFWQGQTQ